MAEVIQGNFLSSLLQAGAQSHGPSNDALKLLRARALDRANALTVPTTRDEDWRFTDLAPLYKSSFQPVAGGAVAGGFRIDEYVLPEAAVRLVFCDGHFSQALSSTNSLPPGVSIGQATDAIGTIAAFEQDAFVALNTSFLNETASIRAERDSTAVVHVLYLVTQSGGVSYPRLFVAAQPGANITVIEEHASLEPASALVNAVTEIDAGSGASVCHVKLQRQSGTQFHIGQVSARLARGARFASHSVTLGARLSRNNLHIIQAGEGAECSMDGLALLDGRQHADTHSIMDHAKPHGRSEQVHKCIVDGAARAVFNGKILVREGAQLTNASQQNRNLLLSERARVDTKPQLEIYADDVKCAHGATVGQLEADELFYLRTRGLSESAARALLTYAFAAEVIERIPVKSLVGRLEAEVLRRTALEGQS
ncbi:MAG: Fe-S cluster assembly protein SufD [Burkholderiales bacterium]